MRRRMITSRVSLLGHSNELFAFHNNRGWTSANTFETPSTRPNTTDTHMLLVHCTYPTYGYEVTFPMSYRNVRFFLSPLPRTALESATIQTPMRSTQWKVATLALRPTSFILYYLDKKYWREDTPGSVCWYSYNYSVNNTSSIFVVISHYILFTVLFITVILSLLYSSLLTDLRR